jgi:Tol biopolymer transport system component
MPLSPGTRLGAYTITAPLGAGGMGEVYRARDTRLDRDVALKVLPAAFARDPDRLARFDREAKAVAALSHPNVLGVFDTGTAVAEPGDGEAVSFVAMELLTGETLGERLRAGALPVRKATEIARLIARGLAAAHDKGLVHRDLKPDNVFLTEDGQVKLLDFGLARQVVDQATATMTSAPLTDAGTVLGTVGYMAPEQVRGAAVDHRADLFALGAVLYEMLSGERAFKRDTAAETMTAILHADPPDFAPSRAIPPALDRIVRHCLEKQPAERFQTARDVAFALETLSGAGPGSTPAVAGGPAVAAGGAGRLRLGRPERLAWLAATAACAGLAAWLALARPAPVTEGPPVVRARLPLPAGSVLSNIESPGRRLALSRDGRRLAFVARAFQGDPTQSSLWVQSLDGEAATQVPGTKRPGRPFWSPDGRTLAFFDEGRLMKAGLDGAPPTTLGTYPGHAGEWATDGRILLFDTGGRTRLLDADGRERPLLAPAAGELILWPSLLPDARHLIFAFSDRADAAAAGTYLADVDGTPKRRLFTAEASRDGINVVVAGNHVIFARAGMLQAVPIEPTGLEIAGEPASIAGPVEWRPGASAAYAISDRVLVYEPARTAAASQLTWFDRTGRRLGTVGDEGDYSNLELSPDGTQLLVSLPDAALGTRDIWLVDLRRGVPSRVTIDPADERSAVWGADGRTIIFRKSGDLYVRALGRGTDQPLVVDGISKDPRGWASHGDALLYRASGAATGNDLWVKPAAGDPRPVIATPFNESYGTLSPDGRWLAYVSDESGQFDVYVTDFPSAAGKWRVSSRGGDFPQWRADGRELYFVSGGDLMGTTVRAVGDRFDVDEPASLFKVDVPPGAGTQFVVMPGGERFLINAARPAATAAALAVVVNWQELARRR